MLSDPHGHLLMLQTVTEVAGAGKSHAAEYLLARLLGPDFSGFDGIWGDLSGRGFGETFGGSFGGGRFWDRID